MAKNTNPSGRRQVPSPELGQGEQSGHPGHVTGQTMAAKVAAGPTAIVAKDSADQPIPTPTKW